MIAVELRAPARNTSNIEDGPPLTLVGPSIDGVVNVVLYCGKVECVKCRQGLLSCVGSN